MASYALFLGKPRTGRPDAEVGIADVDVAADRRIAHGEALLALVARAAGAAGTLVFFGD